MVVIRWSGTAMYVIGMVLTAANVFPTNLIFGALGGTLWALVGHVEKDRALLVVEVASAAIYTVGLLHWLDSQFHILAPIVAYIGISHH
jgi:hypothetical protein